MAQYRMQISLFKAGEPSRDEITNTFYLDTDALSGADDPAALANDAATLWATAGGYAHGLTTVKCRAYDMSDAMPREPVAEEDVLLAGVTTGGAPREVALCLSYFAGTNRPRNRGRMFIGPWSSTDERPSAANRTKLQTLAEGISGLGGVNVQWVQYSPTLNRFANVTDYFIDDEWDTVRSRGLRATTRTVGTVSG